MPLYEYVCRGCDHEVEVLVRGDERPQCPDCGGAELTKLLSVPAAHSAGPGTGVGRDAGPPTGPCGSACGCFPAG